MMKKVWRVMGTGPMGMDIQAPAAMRAAQRATPRAASISLRPRRGDFLEELFLFWFSLFWGIGFQVRERSFLKRVNRENRVKG
jgi:hypothetical protein